MFEHLGLEGWTPVQASVVFGLLLGAAFGILAQRSRFCLRRGLAGSDDERSGALGTWVMGLAAAIAGTAAVSAYGLVDFGGHRFLSSSVPVVAIIAGGVLFGAGMVLTRGCASRLTVLAGTGNLRAVLTILVFAVVAHATLKGVLAPLRVWLQEFSIDVGSAASLTGLLGSAIVPGGLLAVALAVFAARSTARWPELTLGAAIGALVPLGWIGTGYLLRDEFDPLAIESLSFTSTATEALFWTVAGTAIAPAFGVGLFGGAVAGSMIAALASGEFEVVGFTQQTPTGRYLAGGSMMGFGGVLAGGCTIGAGLSGVSLLSLAAMLALVSIIAGGLLARAVSERGFGTSQRGLVAAE